MGARISGSGLFTFHQRCKRAFAVILDTGSTVPLIQTLPEPPSGSGPRNLNLTTLDAQNPPG